MAFDAVTQLALPSREVTELHLLRHGKVRTGGRRLAYGHLDLPLSDQGEEQKEALLRFATGVLPRPDGVISSDLTRCTQLAEPLAQALDLPLRRFSELREQHMGAWEGRAWEDLTREELPGVRAYWDDYLHTAPPGGESLVQLFTRVAGWWQAHEAELRGGRWILVTHMGVIRALLCHHLRLPADEALRLAPAPGSHTHLLLAEAGAVLQTLGERPEQPRRPATRAHAPRIALSGSAGVGKSTLGRALARRLELPFIEEGMRTRIEAGLNLHELSHAGLRALVEELWQEQVAAEERAIAQAGGFVADRSPMDFAAFWLYYGFTADPEATARFWAQTGERARACDHILLLPWGVLPLVADGVRSSNPWVQRHFQATVEGLLARELEPGKLLRLPEIADLERRLAWVIRRLEQGP